MVLRTIPVWIVSAVCLISCARVRVHLPEEMPLPVDQDCFVAVLASDNNQELSRTFLLNEETTVRIVGQGEGTSFSLVPGFIDSFLNDCIEFFIDLGTVCRQYRFVWGSRKVEGNNVVMDGVEFAQGDPSPTRYIFEIAFPWETLGLSGKPDEDMILRLDISAIDNDAESRKSQIAWSGTDADLYKNWSEFGDFPLAGKRTTVVPVIDGNIDECWSEVERFAATHVIIGEVRDASDLSEWFRILWDETYLYLLIEVEDDVKRQAAFFFDRGSIVDEKDQVVWEMHFDNSIHAGGALKNRRQEDTLVLVSGKYTVRYTTDENHAAGHWDDVPPDDPFSGIKLYDLEK